MQTQGCNGIGNEIVRGIGECDRQEAEERNRYIVLGKDFANGYIRGLNDEVIREITENILYGVLND